MNIIIDTKGQADLVTKTKLVESDDDCDLDDIGIDPMKIKIPRKNPTKSRILSSKDFDLEEFEKDISWGNKKRKQSKKTSHVTKIVKEPTPLDKILEKSVIKPGFETLTTLPAYDLSDKKLKKQRKRDREKSKGEKWFNLPATELTEEVKRDLKVIQMRSALDPKHFYKRNDMQGLPKYFQIGKVMDSPLEYYNGRLTNKERKRTIVDELMADAEFAKYNKRKYKEIIEEKNKLHYKAHRHAKRLKRKKK